VYWSCAQLQAHLDEQFWIGFCCTEPIYLCVGSSVIMFVYFVYFCVLFFKDGFHQHRSNRRFTKLQLFLTVSFIGLAFHQQKLTFAQLQLADCVVNLLSDAAIGWEVLLSSMMLAAVCITFISHFYFLTRDLTDDCGLVKSNWGLTLD